MIDNMSGVSENGKLTGGKSGSNEVISLISTTGSSKSIIESDRNDLLVKSASTEIEGGNASTRFSLRKRRCINYNLKTKKFSYDDDSDYEEKSKPKTRKAKYKLKFYFKIFF
jgi:hypothetical protein